MTAYTDLFGAIEARPEELSRLLEHRIAEDAAMRCRIPSIGIPILTPDGEHLLRGPEIKAANAHDGWVDLKPGNMKLWQARISGIRSDIEGAGKDRSSGAEQLFASGANDLSPGEIVGWIFSREEGGIREKQ